MHTEIEPTIDPSPETSSRIVESPPPIATGDSQPEIAWEKVDIRWIQAERIAGGIFWLVLAVVGLVALVCLMAFVFVGQWVLGLTLGCGTLLLLGIIGLLLWLSPRWSYEAKRWRQVRDGFEIKRGIWWQHHIYIPKQRIQHTDVIRGPLSRKFELATLVIHTAGTHNYQIMLEGLAYPVAEQLRQALLPQGNRDC